MFFIKLRPLCWWKIYICMKGYASKKNWPTVYKVYGFIYCYLYCWSNNFSGNTNCNYLTITCLYPSNLTFLTCIYVSICQVNAFCIFKYFSLKCILMNLDILLKINKVGIIIVWFFQYDISIYLILKTGPYSTYTPGVGCARFVDQNYLLLCMGSSLFPCAKRGGKGQLLVDYFYSNIIQTVFS